MKLEYIILIILAIGFYETSVKDELKARKNKEYIKNNLEIGSKISTFSGIIGEVLDIDGEKVQIITGDYSNHSYLTIKKSEINHIID